MFRKTALTSAIIGAGLVSTAGAAFAGDAPCESHHSGHSTTTSSSDCSNTAGGSIHNGGVENVGSLLNGSQGALGLNACHNLNGNSVLSGNHISVLSLDEAPAEEESAAPAARTARTAQAAPATTQAAPATKAAPAQTTTVPIQG